MIDTRPLWERALATRGSLSRRRGRALIELPGRPLTTSQFVDLVRSLIGLRPLYAPSPSKHMSLQACGQYLSLELLARRARPDCDRCGGSGYFDGDQSDMRCECTGAPQRAQPRGRAPGTGNRSFGYGSAYRRSG